MVERELSTLAECRQFIMFIDTYYKTEDPKSYQRLRTITTDRMVELIKGKECQEA